jgi:hypothetical protein
LRPQMPCHARFQARIVTCVEPPTIHKLAG